MPHVCGCVRACVRACVCMCVCVYLSDYVFAIDEGFKPTYSCHVIKRKYVLGFYCNWTVVFVCLHHHHLREGGRGEGGMEGRREGEREEGGREGGREGGMGRGREGEKSGGRRKNGRAAKGDWMIKQPRNICTAACTCTYTVIYMYIVLLTLAARSTSWALM